MKRTDLLKPIKITSNVLANIGKAEYINIKISGALNMSQRDIA
jgi:hypothetical protein